jgi:acylphosphatase
MRAVVYRAPVPTVRVRVLISGRVQGVGFRYATRREAQRLGLRGWVRNLPDGRVEVVAEGEQAVVDQLVAWCRRGPPGAFVDRHEFERQEPQGGFEGFTIAR